VSPAVFFFFNPPSPFFSPRVFISSMIPLGMSYPLDKVALVTTSSHVLHFFSPSSLEFLSLISTPPKFPSLVDSPSVFVSADFFSLRNSLFFFGGCLPCESYLPFNSSAVTTLSRHLLQIFPFISYQSEDCTNLNFFIPFTGFLFFLFLLFFGVL